MLELNLRVTERQVYFSRKSFLNAKRLYKGLGVSNTNSYDTRPLKAGTSTEQSS